MVYYFPFVEHKIFFLAAMGTFSTQILTALPNFIVLNLVVIANAFYNYLERLGTMQQSAYCGTKSGR